MTDFAAHFEGIGMTTAEAHSRAALFRELDERGGSVLNGPPEWYRFSPGRVEIFGKHTDYAGGQSLLAAVPRGRGPTASCGSATSATARSLKSIHRPRRRPSIAACADTSTWWRAVCS